MGTTNWKITLFQEIGLVARQTRVQLPDSYICAKLVDFALSAVEEMVRHFDVTMSELNTQRVLPLYLLLGDIYYIYNTFRNDCFRRLTTLVLVLVLVTRRYQN